MIVKKILKSFLEPTKLPHKINFHSRKLFYKIYYQSRYKIREFEEYQINIFKDHGINHSWEGGNGLSSPFVYMDGGAKQTAIEV